MESYPYTQSDHDEAAESGCLWLMIIALVILAVMAWGVIS